ncbi:AhpD-like protein [Epithele typhae]|uniref:AhpD-like protein n=1 Tax=Epithele typhae TaxID=378194 RepID=UPI002007FF56|nr:AhpD-like protein [Epithele typhae]KAH9923445.1 AhpD-like protein [Epithele typhae]
MQHSSSRLIPGRYPPPGESPIADAIRARRGERGLLPLDGALLHVPPIAEGWSALLGAVRTKGRLPGDVRELMILRVAAHNGATFEWIAHEKVARAEGLGTAQLLLARDLGVVGDAGVLTELQLTDRTTDELRAALGGDDDLFVEAAAVVATYNMVSRFLVATDVAGLSDEPVPWPTDFATHMHQLPTQHEIPYPDAEPDAGLTLHVETHTVSPTAPWLRGHGRSSTPPTPPTIATLAADVAHILATLHIPRAHAASASPRAAPSRCTSRRPSRRSARASSRATPRPLRPRERDAWDARIDLARTQGMPALAAATLPRWFPAGSALTAPRREAVGRMVAGTAVDGFAAGARALMAYDLYAAGLEGCAVPALLVAGALDGDGKVAAGLRALRERWAGKGGDVRVAVVEGAGHLPMVDATAGSGRS